MRYARHVKWSARLVVLVVLTAGALARAEPDAERDALEQRATAALDELRYEQAFPLYEQLERTGRNDLQQTRLIYRRLAEIAASVRQPELATSRYQKLLAIEPGFQLEPGAPQVFRQALEQARKRAGPLAPLEVTTVHTRGEPELGVVVARDVLHLVGGAAVYREGDSIAIARGKGAGTIRIELPAMPRARLRVIVEDAFGNQLIALPLLEVEVVADLAVDPTPRPSARASRRWYARPAVWLGVAGVAAAGVGTALGATVAGRQDTLDAILADSRNHTRAEAETARDRLEERALQANVVFVAAGVLVTGAVIAYVLEPDAESATSVRIAPTREGAVVGLTGVF